MLAEALVYLTSFAQTPAPFRHYLPDAIRFWARGVRQQKAWVPHLSNFRALIDNQIDELSPRRSVVVLGSGALFDIPVEALARTFETVWLVDRAHLSTLRQRTARYDNIRMLWRDLHPAASQEPLDFLHDIHDLDWVISANLLADLARQSPKESAASVIASHLDALVDAGCPVTLVTDVDHRVFDKAGQVIEEVDLLHGAKMPKPDLGWKWEYAPFGEESEDKRRVHQVGAWLDWRHSSPR